MNMGFLLNGLNFMRSLENFITRFLILIIAIFSSKILLAQQYQLEQINQNLSRNNQLLDKIDSSISFTIQSNSVFKPVSVNWKKTKISLLPLLFTQQFNTTKPFGWNDGPMMQAKGYQALARLGVNMKYGFFEAQVAPELVYANNLSYTKIFSGQSFLKAKIGPISVGVSSENLWWGPGINSSLLMSNNAPGFFHGTIGTNKPIKTPIGTFEFSLIGGRLNSNSNLIYENDHPLTRKDNDNWRYLNSYVISWQPKWMNGLFIGVTRSMQEYGKPAFNRSIGLFSKYLPVLVSPTQKANNVFDDTLNRDQLASFFVRWILPKHHAEFYVEYGKNDYGVNFRDYLNAPTHSSAYTIGFRKLVKQTKTKYIQLETEFTQMTESPDHLVRGAGNWYVHWQISQGYTNYNQIIGAGAGFGTNIQTFAATWVNGNLRNGFLVQRFERDPVGRPVKWTDISIGWMPQWEYKNMLIGAKLQLIRYNNDGWEKGNNSFNLHSRVMVQYNLNKP